MLAMFSKILCLFSQLLSVPEYTLQFSKMVKIAVVKKDFSFALSTEWGMVSLIIRVFTITDHLEVSQALAYNVCFVISVLNI